MKTFCYIAFVTLATAGTLSAQTNATTNTAAAVNANTNAVNQILALVTTNPPPAKPQLQETVIQADGPADFDQTEYGLRVIHRENVRVDSPTLRLRCEWLAADLSQATGQPTNIVAETNVVINAIDDQGHKMHATGDKAVYVYGVTDGLTNETVTLTGHATAEYQQVSVQGDTIILDLAHHTMNVPTGPTTVIRGSFTGRTAGTNSLVETNAPVAGTNSSTRETNLPPAATSRPIMDTNFPPGKLDLIPSKISKPEPK